MRATAFDLLYLLLAVGLLPWFLVLVGVRRRKIGSLSERCGLLPVEPPAPGRERVWVHAVSVGELEAILPVVAALEAQRPALEVVLTSTTVAARELGHRRRPGRPHFLFPLDLGPCVRRALARLQPDAVVLVELELWPNLLAHLSAARIPVLVANGRISARGARRMARTRWLFGRLLRRVDRLLAQSEEIAERMRALGAPPDRLRVAGNLKFDRPPILDPAGHRERFEAAWGYTPGAPRWIAGCTHAGEESQLLEVQRALRAARPGLSLILAPRHVERAAEVLALARAAGCSAELLGASTSAAAPPPDRASHDEAPPDPRPQPPEVIVVDRIGVLAELYACADAAFVGGSLVPHGGHNLLEPILAGTPCVHGPHTANFRAIAELLETGGASRRVADGRALGDVLNEWLSDPVLRKACVRRAEELLADHRGAAAATVAEIQALLPARPAGR